MGGVGGVGVEFLFMIRAVDVRVCWMEGMECCFDLSGGEEEEIGGGGNGSCGEELLVKEGVEKG